MNNQTATTYQYVNSANQITGVVCNGKFRDHLTGNFPADQLKCIQMCRNKQSRNKSYQYGYYNIWRLDHPGPLK